MPLTTDQKLSQRNRFMAKCRGWIINFLYNDDPMPIDFESLIFLLDQKNHPLSARGLAKELDLLRKCELIRVFPNGAESSLDDVAQAKLIQRYLATEGENDHNLCATLTSRGINFQEGHFEEAGIARVG